MAQTLEVATTSTNQIPVGGFDILTPLLNAVFGSGGAVSGVGLAGVWGFVVGVWNVYVVLAYAASFIFLYLYVYASTQWNKLEEAQAEKIATEEKAYARKHERLTPVNRFSELQAHGESDNPNDWKLAIIEADIIMDEEFKRLGYAGTSIGERLRSISPSAMQTLDDAWEAHKVRNQVAHAGADFVLTQKLARETLMRYERVFNELGIG